MFSNVLAEIESEQEEYESGMGFLIKIQLYVTSLKPKYDVCSFPLHQSLDLYHKKKGKDLISGLKKTKARAGKPDWDEIFTGLNQEMRGQITVFYCGNQEMGRVVRKKSAEFNFNFKKQVT